MAPSKTVVVTSAPVTPNGDLHLGHLAGPYLGADIHVRYLRLRGVRAFHITGSDDFQSYVAAYADRSGTAPGEVAEHFADRIEAALAAADVRPDQFTRPLRVLGYADAVVTFVSSLRERGLLEEKETDGLVCANCGRYRFEFGVRGRCPFCGEPCAGNTCEECGRPNNCVDLIEPSCVDCAVPLDTRPYRRLVIPLADHASVIAQLLEQRVMGTHLRALSERMIAEGLPELAVTHPFSWGIPASEAGVPEQVVWAWLEMGLSYLIGVRELGQRLRWDVAPESLSPPADVDLVQFFGFDNAYYHTVFYPLLYRVCAPEWHPSVAFVGNEFYRLDDRKFSTSRKHALWAADVLAGTPSDLIRFHLSLTRPETEQTNFSWDEFTSTVNRELRGQWQTWVTELGRRVASLASEAPSSDHPTDEHRRFQADLSATARTVARAYEASTFSPQQATRELGELVRRARRFGHAEEHWSGVSSREGELRNALALELAAARSLALLSSPIMPRFAEAMWHDLGCGGSVEANGWEEVPENVPPGSHVEFRSDYF